MEELQDLVRIISNRRLKTIDILNNPDYHRNGRSRISRFYPARAKSLAKR